MAINKENIKYFLTSKKNLSFLVVTTIAFWLIITSINIFNYLFTVAGDQQHIANFFINFFALPSNINEITKHPWSPISYIFIHDSFFHLLFNLLVLIFAGQLFCKYLNNRLLILAYIIGGLFGALFFVLAMNIFPVFVSNTGGYYVIGASAAALSILSTITTYIPENYIEIKFIGKIKIKYITILILVFDFINISKGNAGGHFAHIGGISFGLLFGYFCRKQSTIVKFSKKASSQFLKKKQKGQSKIDIILKKISSSGYQSLSTEEKDILFSKSKR